MSVTTVLVPVLEPEAEALFEGEPAPELASRARTLRPRVARVDAVRDELHELLFPRWAEARAKPPNAVRRLASLFRRDQSAPASEGYDPFVQLFGRSLPLDGPPRTVVEALARALQADDDAFTEVVASHLRGLDARAEKLFRDAPTPPPPDELDAAIALETKAIATALAASPPELGAALDAVARLSAWSWPVWRLDGQMLPDLLRTLGIGVVSGRATALFEPLAETRPAITAALPSLPERLPDFARAGSFLTSAEVRLVAGALRLRRGLIAKNVADSGESAALVMRDARLLEEAVLFCEARSLALLEAAGVEWHERYAKKTRATS